MAKVQWSATWEMSAVPYIPVPNLIVQHCENLRKAGIQGLMMSWTVGGYPSPNFDAARAFYFSPSPDPGDALRRAAERRYGKEAAPAILEAWQTFSQAFAEFPYGLAIYTIPTQHGPSNALRLHPTGYKAAMMLFPYDDYKTWAGALPFGDRGEAIRQDGHDVGTGSRGFSRSPSARARPPTAQPPKKISGSPRLVISTFGAWQTRFASTPCALSGNPGTARNALESPRS